MIKLTDLIQEAAGRTIHIYDFDDTLVKTNTTVKLVKADGTSDDLDSHEFATHKLKSGEKWDFVNFDKMIGKSKPLLKNISFIKKSLNTPNIKTTILTARRLAFPIMYHLRKKYNIHAYVIGVGGSNPELKADWIEKQVRDHGYTTVKFVDDAKPNLDAVIARLKKYPNVKLTTIHIK